MNFALTSPRNRVLQDFTEAQSSVLKGGFVGEYIRELHFRRYEGGDEEIREYLTLKYTTPEILNTNPILHPMLSRM